MARDDDWNRRDDDWRRESSTRMEDERRYGRGWREDEYAGPSRGRGDRWQSEGDRGDSWWGRSRGSEDDYGRERDRYRGGGMTGRETDPSRYGRAEWGSSDYGTREREYGRGSYVPGEESRGETSRGDYRPGEFRRGDEWRYGQGAGGGTGTGYGGYAGSSTDYGRGTWGESQSRMGRGGMGGEGQWRGQDYGRWDYEPWRYRENVSTGSFGATSGYWGGRSYAGRGPQSYRRSDDRIREDVNDRLTDHPWIDATDIEVDVRDCEVTLRGTVDDREQKRLAEDITESVSGVKDVHNHIHVNKDKERDRSRWSRTEAGTMATAGTMAAGASATAMGGSLRTQVRPGMEVVGSDGDRIGSVKELRDQDFLVDRPMKRDVFVPFQAVRECRGEQVVLHQRTDEVGNMNWEHPAVMGAGPNKER